MAVIARSAWWRQGGVGAPPCHTSRPASSPWSTDASIVPRELEEGSCQAPSCQALSAWPLSFTSTKAPALRPQRHSPRFFAIPRCSGDQATTCACFLCGARSPAWRRGRTQMTRLRNHRTETRSLSHLRWLPAPPRTGKPRISVDRGEKAPASSKPVEGVLLMELTKPRRGQFEAHDSLAARLYTTDAHRFWRAKGRWARLGWG